MNRTTCLILLPLFCVHSAYGQEKKLWTEHGRFPAHETRIADLAITSRNELISGSGDGLICFWRVSDFKKVRSTDLKDQLKKIAPFDDNGVIALGIQTLVSWYGGKEVSRHNNLTGAQTFVTLGSKCCLIQEIEREGNATFYSITKNGLVKGNGVNFDSTILDVIRTKNFMFFRTLKKVHVFPREVEEKKATSIYSIEEDEYINALDYYEGTSVLLIGTTGKKVKLINFVSKKTTRECLVIGQVGSCKLIGEDAFVGTTFRDDSLFSFDKSLKVTNLKGCPSGLIRLAGDQFLTSLQKQVVVFSLKGEIVFSHVFLSEITAYVASNDGFTFFVGLADGSISSFRREK